MNVIVSRRLSETKSSKQWEVSLLLDQLRSLLWWVTPPPTRGPYPSHDTCNQDVHRRQEWSRQRSPSHPIEMFRHDARQGSHRSGTPRITTCRTLNAARQTPSTGTAIPPTRPGRVRAFYRPCAEERATRRDRPSTRRFRSLPPVPINECPGRCRSETLVPMSPWWGN